MIYYAANVTGDTETTNDPTGHYVEVEQLGPSRLKFTYRGKSVVVDSNELSDPTDIVFVYLGSPAAEAFSDTQKLALVWDSERFNSRSTASSLLDRKGLVNLTEDVFAVGFAGGDIWVYCRRSVKFLPEGAVLADVNVAEVQPRDWFSNESPELAAFIHRNRAKRKLLAHVKPENSIAALEKQVDLLTLVVAELVANRPAPDWFHLLEDVVNLKGTNTIKSAAEAIEEISTNKTEIRALQSAYYTART